MAMIDGLYVHLPLKRAMHAVDPIQRLRLLRVRLERMSDRAFHDDLFARPAHDARSGGPLRVSARLSERAHNGRYGARQGASYSTSSSRDGRSDGAGSAISP
jgi:hypothetical protein